MSFIGEENHRLKFSDNSNEVLEENNVPGSDKIIHSPSYFLADETGGDVIGKKRIVREKRSTGYKVDFISNAFKSIGTVSAKIAPRLKCYKTASRLKRYNSPMDNAIDFVFSTIHSDMV